MQQKPARPHIRSVRREIVPPRRQRPGCLGVRLGVAVALAAAVGGVWYYWQQQAPAAHAEMETAVRYGTVVEQIEADALLVRKESVVIAPEGGMVRRLVAEGERVRVGSPVVEIVPGNAALPPTGTPPESAPPPTSTPQSPAPPPTSTPQSPAPPPTSTSQSPAPSPTSTPPTTSAGQEADSAAQREFDRLSSEIYQALLALREAQSAGDAERALAAEGRVNDLIRRQTDLLPQLNRSGAASAPPAPAPAPSLPAPDPPTPAFPAPDPPQMASRGGRQVAAPQSGIVLYQTDGLEERLSLTGASEWTASWLRAMPSPDPRQTVNGVAAAGQPLFKVVDDLYLDLVLLLPAESVTTSQRTVMAQDGVELQLTGQARPLTAKVQRMAEEGEELLLHLRVPSAGSDALRVRRVRVSLLLQAFEGIIVPRSAIDVQDGLTGVWVSSAGEYRFTPVQVLGGNRDEVAVAGDLAPDARVRTVGPGPLP